MEDNGSSKSKVLEISRKAMSAQTKQRGKLSNTELRDPGVERLRELARQVPNSETLAPAVF
jgi:hypothetical protein